MPTGRRKFKWELFARDLKARRAEFKMGLRAMARMLEVHHSTLCRAENGKPIDVPNFAYLCNFMDRPPDRYLYPCKPQV